MSASSGSAQSGLTADDLLKNLLDSVTPTAGSGDDSSASKTATTQAPQPSATIGTPAPASTDQSVASTADTEASSSKGSGMGLSIGLGIGAVLLVAFVVLYFRQRKKRRYKAPGHDRDLGTPQLSIELPRPPPQRYNSGAKPQDDDRMSVFTSVQHGGESVFTTAGEVSPVFQNNMRSAPSAQYRASNKPQSGPASMTFHMDGGHAALNPPTANPIPDSSKTTKLTHVVAGRVSAFGNPRAAPVLTEGGGSLPRDTNASTSSLNSLHDSQCGDFFKHGDGLGERIRAQSRTKHPSMVLEEDEESSSRSNQPVASHIAAAVSAGSYRPGPLGAAAAPTPNSSYAAPATPLAAPSVPAQRRAPPPPLPPAGAFVKPPTIVASSSQMYRPSTEDEITFQRLSTMSSDSIGSMKRASTESANPRAGSMIEINEIVGGEGSQRAKEIEI